MKPRQSDRETQYRPQAGKTLRQALRSFIAREFPRLGGPWVVNLFVDRLLQIVDQYQVEREKLQPGQVLWPAIAIDESPGYRKPVYATRQVPVVPPWQTRTTSPICGKGSSGMMSFAELSCGS